MHAMQTSVSATLGGSPEALVFSRTHCSKTRTTCEWKRGTYDYIVGQRVLKKVHDPTKLGERTKGPYRIRTVQVNGTVTIELDPNVTERINIKRIIQYREI